MRPRYEIEADSSSGGTISPSGNVWVSRGSSKTFTFKPNSGYEIEAVYVDGDKVSGTPSSYRFSNVRDDHTIYVEFERRAETSSKSRPTQVPAAASLPPAHPL